MLMATWNCFSIPIEISLKPKVTDSLYYLLLNSVIDILFLVDILITFRTTYIVPSTGNEISEPKAIAKQYLKGRFWMDLLATIPFDLIAGDNPNFQFTTLFGLLKTTRVLRLGRIIRFINTRDDIKLTLKLLQLVYFLVLYLHLIGCCWFLIHNINQEWIPPQDYMFVKTELYSQNDVYKYFHSFYYSVNMLNGNEIGPRSVGSLTFVSVILLLGAIVNANIFGNMAVIIQDLNKKASKYQEKIDIANTAMKNLKINKDLQLRVINYLLYTQSNRDHQKELEQFKDMISPSLQMEVNLFIFGNIVKMDSLISNFYEKSFLPEDYIMKQGDDPDSLYFLYKGE